MVSIEKLSKDISFSSSIPREKDKFAADVDNRCQSYELLESLKRSCAPKVSILQQSKKVPELWHLGSAVIHMGSAI